MDVVIEGDNPNLTVSFYDENNVLTAPASATWRVVDVDTGQEVKASAAITPIADSVTLTLPTEATAIVNDTLKFETKRIIIEATFGDSRKKLGLFLYQVQNIGES